MTIPIARQIKCVAREIALRKAVYPRRVSQGKMRQGEADDEIDSMVAVLATLEWCAANRAAIRAAAAAVNTDASGDAPA